MANPTTNFGWQMPTSTDLVTDLPADFEVFGQAVDTALVDLKGGTTGQVLSKASNTNMDFTWVTTDDANAIQNTIVDAKGDLISATGSDVPARLAVGANGETLVADSSTATGLDWKSAAEQYPWQTWTPTYDRITIGNGTVEARYQQIGKTVNFYWSWIWGSTSSVVNYPVLTMPVSARTTNQYAVGVATLLDVTGLNYFGFVQANSGSLLYIVGGLTNGTYLNEAVLDTGTTATWTTNDRWTISGSYEAA